ncbi:MAG: DUF1538 family protein [Bacillota bacterium]
MHKVKETFREVIFAMLPVVAVVALLQVTILWLPGEVLWRFFGGAVMVGGGLFLFFAVSAFTPSRFIPISFDAGGVTTGPMAVPFILALGVGVAPVLGGNQTTADRFGLVALASIGPVLASLCNRTGFF